MHVLALLVCLAQCNCDATRSTSTTVSTSAVRTRYLGPFSPGQTLLSTSTTTSSPVAEVVVSPVVYSLRDATGQSWTSRDPYRLASFVAARNRGAVPVFDAAPVYRPTTFASVPTTVYRPTVATFAAPANCPTGTCAAGR